MNVCGRRCVWVCAVLLVAIGALYPLGKYLHVFDAPLIQDKSEWQREYWAAVFKADAATDSKDWQEVARQYEVITHLSPYSPAVRFNRAAALAHVGRAVDALAELRLAVECGWVKTDVVRSDPLFREVRAEPGFKRLLERANEVADEQIVVYVPRGLSKTSAAPLIITYHGKGENPHSHIQSWKHAADQLGAVVVAARGNKRIGQNGNASSFSWVTGGGQKERGSLLPLKNLLQRSIELAKRRATIDEDRILLAGYSQGGSVALALLADTPARFRGAVVEATSYSSRILKRWPQDEPRNSARVYVLVHEFDRMRQPGEQAYRDLKDMGIDARLKLITGADHELPLDDGMRLIEAVRFVLRLDPASR